MLGSNAVDLIHDKRYIAALAWANKLRAKTGLHELEFLPRAEGCRCPIETAVPAIIAQRASTTFVQTNLRHEVWPTPEMVQRFVYAFDQGMFPDLLRTPGVRCEADNHRPRCPQSLRSRFLSASGV